MGYGSFSVVNPPPPIARIRRTYPRFLWKGARIVDDLRAKVDWPFFPGKCPIAVRVPEAVRTVQVDYVVAAVMIGW